MKMGDREVVAVAGCEGMIREMVGTKQRRKGAKRAKKKKKKKKTEKETRGRISGGSWGVILPRCLKLFEECSASRETEVTVCNCFCGSHNNNGQQ